MKHLEKTSIANSQRKLEKLKALRMQAYQLLSSSGNDEMERRSNIHCQASILVTEVFKRVVGLEWNLDL